MTEPAGFDPAGSFCFVPDSVIEGISPRAYAVIPVDGLILDRPPAAFFLSGQSVAFIDIAGPLPVHIEHE